MLRITFNIANPRLIPNIHLLRLNDPFSMSYLSDQPKDKPPITYFKSLKISENFKASEISRHKCWSQIRRLGLNSMICFLKIGHLGFWMAAKIRLVYELSRLKGANRRPPTRTEYG